MLARLMSLFLLGLIRALTGAQEAARLAVMLPSPKFFERRFGSAYLASRTATIVARMPSAELP